METCQKERPSQYEGSDQTEESSEEDGVFSFHTNPVGACEKGLAFHTENSAPPTVCILDLGCTRAMERETHIEYQKSKKKVLHKDNWRTEKKRFSDKMEEFWKGKTVYKIKKDYVIPEDVVRSDIDRQAKLSEET